MAEQEDQVPSVLPYSTAPVASSSAVVWCRLLALVMLGWGAQTAITTLVEIVDYLFRRPLDVRQSIVIAIALFVPITVWFFLGWYCWSKAPALAARMARDHSEDLSPRGMSADELLMTAIIGVGIYLLTGGLPAFAEYFYEISMTPRMGMVPFNYYGGIIGAIVRSALGLWLILGTRGIATIIRRHSGRWRDTNTPPQQNI
jgi:hypothetical protein